MQVTPSPFDEGVFLYYTYSGAESKAKSEKSILKFETTMTYKPAKESSEYDVLSLNDDNRSKNIAGKLEYSLPLAKQVRADKMDFKIGTNFKLDNTNSSSNLDVLGMAQLNSILDTKELTTFLAPYFQTEYIKDKISFKGIFEYQYFKYDEWDYRIDRVACSSSYITCVWS